MPRSSPLSAVASVVAGLILSGATLAHSEGPDGFTNVRPLDASIERFVAIGYARSARFRALVDAIEDSDVIVYVERHPDLAEGKATMRFVTLAGGFRYLRITMPAEVRDDRAIALLGHELQHSVEVASTVWVTDSDAMLKLYQTIGDPFCSMPQWCFETLAAIDAGWKVFAELRYVRERSSHR